MTAREAWELAGKILARRRARALAGERGATMTKELAWEIVNALGGEVLEKGADRWVVKFIRSDGAVVLLGAEAVIEYADHEAYEEGVDLTRVYLK